MRDGYGDFWSCLDELVKSCRIVVDRPKGHRHPRHPGFVYPVDYGYLEGTASSDGNGIDIWVGSAEPKEIVGILCIVDMMKRDSEIKILYGCTLEEVATILKAQNEKGMRAIHVARTLTSGPGQDP